MELEKRGDDRFTFLNDWIGKIVVFKVTNNVFPAWRNERHKYLYTGHITDQNLREVLPHEVVIEFDDADHNPLPMVQQEAEYWIDQIKNQLNKYRIGFKITHHAQGKSPHIRLNIDGLEDCPVWQRKLYKLGFVKDILNTINFKSKLIVPDFSLLNSAAKVVSLEHQPHFKYGTTEDVIYTNTHPQMRVRQEKLRTLSKETRNTSQNLSTTPSVGLNLPRLASAFSKHYREGRRHFIITGYATLMRLKGYPLRDAINTFYQMPVQRQDNERDALEISIRYNEPITELSASAMFRMAYQEEYDAKNAYIDFLKCFQLFGDDL